MFYRHRVSNAISIGIRLLPNH